MKSKLFFLSILPLLLILRPLGWSAEPDPRVKQATEYLEAWRISEAERIAAGLFKENSRSAAALDLSAEVAFYQGRYDEAARLVEQALAIDSAGEERQALRLRMQRTRDTVDKLERFESEHFIFHLDRKSVV